VRVRLTTAASVLRRPPTGPRTVAADSGWAAVAPAGERPSSTWRYRGIGLVIR